MLIYELPPSSLKCRAQPNVIRRSFEPHDQMLYHRTILEPHTAYPIPAGTNYIVLTVQKTAFGLDIIPESLLPQLIQKGFHVGDFRQMNKFNQTPYKLPPPTPIHVPAEKRPLEEKSLPFSKKRSKLPDGLEPVKIPDVLEPVQIPDVLEPVQIPDVLEPVQIPLVPQSPVQIPVSHVLEPPVQIPVSHVSEPPVQIPVSQVPKPPVQIPLVQIPDVPEHVQIPVSHVSEPPVQIPVSQVPQSPVQIPLVQIPDVPEPVQIPVSQVPQPPMQTCIRTPCSIRTCADSRCFRTCADSNVTSPTATYADSPRTYADSTWIRTCADSSVPSPTVTCAESPRTYAASPRARHFGPFGVDRCIRPAHVVRIWTPRTPAASHGTLYF
ncbi:uncharacterized protein TNCV_5066781 [Trichonephila clavipes]|nr:uncharacterized protein TNCV_5066781 [Trichonephila clavipes]